ncbi:hypothetical protein C6341_g27379 [Phytophthora cactorum]|nr:hypothetical protein C6341_g27379 [Phytophthora cactorum]
MPTNYGSDISDVHMEDGEVSSSAADSESAAVAHEPVTGSRRPREDDPSASSSKRSRNDEKEKAPTPVTPSSPPSVPTERAPWMPSASEIASRFGATSPPNLSLSKLRFLVHVRQRVSRSSEHRVGPLQYSAKNDNHLAIRCEMCGDFIAIRSEAWSV